MAWQLRFHDAYPMGWVITAAYFLVACLCFVTWHKSKSRCSLNSFSVQPRIWLLLSLLLLFLGINKQLDLHNFLREWGRVLVIDFGWYDARREIQRWFIRVLVGAGVLALLFLGWFFFTRLTRQKEMWPIAIGLGCVAVFILIRAASFNHVDYLLSKWRIIGPFRMKYVAELGGILLVGLGAGMKLVKVRRG